MDLKTELERRWLEQYRAVAQKCCSPDDVDKVYIEAVSLLPKLQVSYRTEPGRKPEPFEVFEADYCCRTAFHAAVSNYETDEHRDQAELEARRALA